MSEPYRPVARSAGLVVREVGEELLILDTEFNRAHALNAPAATVWRTCNGERDLIELQEMSGLTKDEVRLALEQLHDRNLVAEPVTGVSRRAVLRDAAAIGGGLGITLPLIQSITAPTPAMAASGATGPTGPTGATGPGF